MNNEQLGKIYTHGENIFRQGDIGNALYVIQAGEVEILIEKDGCEDRLRILKAGDIFGEMALFEKTGRSATARALGEARVLTIDKRTLLRRIKEDPIVALDLMEVLCKRIRELSAQRPSPIIAEISALLGKH